MAKKTTFADVVGYIDKASKKECDIIEDLAGSARLKKAAEEKQNKYTG